MLNKIKRMCGIADVVTIYDDEIKIYMDDCLDDMRASGVPDSIIKAQNPGVITAAVLYTKAYLGNDRAYTDKYLNLYRKKVSRLALEEEENVDKKHSIPDEWQ
ncbi:hypothetical protein [Blautia marasmi]|uniref:phage head-tail connector protein n=1 Tax=Blautia marasmi TaxID=1917868 RepID=UPI00266B7675|nr:hypothetical protein [Blautia marasmi]